MRRAQVFEFRAVTLDPWRRRPRGRGLKHGKDREVAVRKPWRRPGPAESHRPVAFHDSAFESRDHARQTQMSPLMRRDSSRPAGAALDFRAYDSCFRCLIMVQDSEVLRRKREEDPSA